jgi:signal transduction histidine kinase
MAQSARTIAEPTPRGGSLTPRAGAVDDYLELVRHARSRRVARDLVELWRLQNGAERAERAVFDLAALLATVCENNRDVVLSGPDNVSIAGDARRVARIAVLVLDNARLYGASPVFVDYDDTSISITDSGGGFAQRVLDLAPAPFITAERSHGRGVGLGLAIAYRQAELIGARLTLSNAAHGGARVSCSFSAQSPR